MKTIILVLMMMLGFQTFAYEDYDPLGGPAAQAEMDRIHEHHRQQAAEIESRVISLLSQKLGGNVGFRKYDSSYMLCRQSYVNSCALQDPLTSCPQGCSGGDPLYVCWVQRRSLRSGMPAATSVYCNSYGAKWNNRRVISEAEMGLVY